MSTKPGELTLREYDYVWCVRQDNKTRTQHTDIFSLLDYTYVCWLVGLHLWFDELSIQLVLKKGSSPEIVGNAIIFEFICYMFAHMYQLLIPLLT